MISSAEKRTEICVTVVNEVGSLARLTSFLVNHGINVETISGYANNLGDQGELYFITDNNDGAVNELETNGYTDVTENEVLIVELDNQPGALKNISEVLANHGVNINYFYCTTCRGGCPAKIVISTTNNEQALKLLRG